MSNNVIDYADGPLLFLATCGDKLHLGVMVTQRPTDVYLMTEVTEEWLKEFFNEERDLLDTITKAPAQKFYTMEGYREVFEKPDVKMIPFPTAEMLPLPGYFTTFEYPNAGS